MYVDEKKNIETEACFISYITHIICNELNLLKRNLRDWRKWSVFYDLTFSDLNSQQK